MLKGQLIASNVMSSEPHKILNSDQNELWGVVLVDLRPSKLPPYHRTLKTLKRLEQISPHIPVELWVSQVVYLSIAHYVVWLFSSYFFRIRR
jgi:hypothetical protein